MTITTHQQTLVIGLAIFAGPIAAGILLVLQIIGQLGLEGTGTIVGKPWEN